MRATSPTLMAMALNIFTLIEPTTFFAQASDPLVDQADSSIRADSAEIDELNMKAMIEGSVRVIVGVDASTQSQGAHSEREIQTQQAAISRAQDDVLGRLASRDVRQVRRFHYVP